MSKTDDTPPQDAASATTPTHAGSAPSAHALPPPAPERRTFLTVASKVAMVGGLAASYGTCGAIAGRFLYPAHPTPTAWLFLAEVAAVAVGDALTYKAPSGQPIVVARLADAGTAEDFLALSSVCPHLGCAVHWEAANDRFFCPCHNGVFDRAGKGTAGPPAKAGQSLGRYPVKVEGGLLYIQVPVERPEGT